MQLILRAFPQLYIGAVHFLLNDNESSGNIAHQQQTIFLPGLVTLLEGVNNVEPIGCCWLMIWSKTEWNSLYNTSFFSQKRQKLIFKRLKRRKKSENSKTKYFGHFRMCAAHQSWPKYTTIIQVYSSTLSIFIILF